MSEQANNYTNLMAVVQSYCNEKNEKSLTRVEKYLQLAVEGFSQLNTFELNSIETARLTLDTSTMSANLPADFIEMVKIGIEVQGRLWTLTLNQNLIQPVPSTICNVPVPQVNTITDTTVLDSGFFFAPYWFEGYYYTPYGISGGINTAYYKIDYGRNVIMFSGFTGSYPIILEYKSSGISASTIVPRTAVPALKAYIHFANIRHDLRFNEGQIAAAENRYNIELYSLQRLNNSFNYNEIADILYGTFSQSPKR